MVDMQSRIDKIYTYRSPFELNNMSKEKTDELRKYPHLCVSQTLVEGLKAYYGRDNFGIICTVDNLLKKFYESWCDQEENNVKQSIAISNVLEKWREGGTQNSKLLGTLSHNEKEIIKSIKYLVESHIAADDLPKGLSKEQKALQNLYKQIESRKEFQISEPITLQNKAEKKKVLQACYAEILRDELKKYIRKKTIKEYEKEHTETKFKKGQLEDKVLMALINKELKEIQHKIIKYREQLEEERLSPEHRQKYKKWCMQEERKNTGITHIVAQLEKYKRGIGDVQKVFIHGVHQFTPIILHLLSDLKAMGIEIIAMFNYDEQYPEIYKTWDVVYRWTGLAFAHEGNRYAQPRAIGKGLGEIYENNFSAIASAYDEKYYKFEHLTSFCDYVGDEYEKATLRYQKEQSQKHRGSSKKAEQLEEDDNSKLRKIALMDEQFYAINGSEINDLLKLYFPEQFSSRHFLTYPIGQFILSLYRMWDDDLEIEQIDRLIANNKDPKEASGLKLHIDEMKEALSLSIWDKEGMPTPLEIFDNLKYYFRNEQTFEQYEQKLKRLKAISKNVPQTLIQKHKRRLPFFIYTSDELEYFEGVLESIKKIAKDLFSTSRQGIKENLEKIISNIKYLISNPLLEERISDDEIKMVEDIQKRISMISDEGENTYISNIKKTIGLYLQASTSEEYQAEWIVRDFEQIDGGVLLAAAQKRDEGEGAGTKAFHYAGVSDENLLGHSRKELPWPLTNELYRNVNTKDSDIAEICSICRAEYTNFLRYSLFYGTYFLMDNKKINLSYIKEVGDDEAHPYSTMAYIMNIKVEPFKQDINPGEFSGKLEYKLTDIEIRLPYNMTDREKRSMETCSMRYLWNHCLDQDTYFSDEFQVERVAKQFVTSAYLENTNNQENTAQKWMFNEEEFEKFKKYMPIFDEMDWKEIRYAIQNKNGKKDTAIYIDNVMEFIYRDWKKYGQSKEAVVEEFMEWLEGEDEIVWEEEKCKNCNQHGVCEVYIMRDEREVVIDD